MVVKAIIRLMETHGFDDEEAYRRLRQESMHSRVSVEELSARIIARDKTANRKRAPGRCTGMERKKGNSNDGQDSKVACGRGRSSNSIAPDRRTVVKGMATAGMAAGVALPTYLRGFETSAYAQTGAPVKMGFIEDESGNLSVYGIQKLHAAQLAVAEINAGKTLKGAPDIGAGMLGAEATVAKNPPVISREGTSLTIVDHGGDKSPVDLAYVEDADILIDSGEKGILGRELQLLSSDGRE